MINFKDCHFPSELILTCVRWHVTYWLSFRNIEEMMSEQGSDVDHSTIQRWVVRFSPQLKAELTKKWKRPTGSSRCMDETYIKVKGEWEYLYRTVDKEGKTIDFLLTVKRDKKVTLQFFKKATGTGCTPIKIKIDKNGSNTAALNELNKNNKNQIKIRQNKYLNNLAEQDYRPTKEKAHQTKGFGKFHTAHKTIKGIEPWRLLKTRQHILGWECFIPLPLSCSMI